MYNGYARRGHVPLLALVAVLACAVVSIWSWVMPDDPRIAWVLPASRVAVDAGLWQVLWTAALLHANVAHLANNVLSLAWVGTSYESRRGHVAFALVLLAGVGVGNLVHVRVSASPVVGVSGGIFALFGAQTVALAHDLVSRDPDDPRRAFAARGMASLVRLVMWNIAYGLLAPGVSNGAHLGGLVAGVTCGLLVELLVSVTRAAVSGSGRRPRIPRDPSGPGYDDGGPHGPVGPVGTRSQTSVSLGAALPLDDDGFRERRHGTRRH
jgi:membrane associated rhomboid family serine protease